MSFCATKNIKFEKLRNRTSTKTLCSPLPQEKSTTPFFSFVNRKFKICTQRFRKNFIYLVPPIVCYKGNTMYSKNYYFHGVTKFCLRTNVPFLYLTTQYFRLFIVHLLSLKLWNEDSKSDKLPKFQSIF